MLWLRWALTMTLAAAIRSLLHYLTPISEQCYLVYVCVCVCVCVWVCIYNYSMALNVNASVSVIYQTNYTLYTSVMYVLVSRLDRTCHMSQNSVLHMCLTMPLISHRHLDYAVYFIHLLHLPYLYLLLFFNSSCLYRTDTLHCTLQLTEEGKS